MSSLHDSIDGYEKLRMVGKGAFGTATLYRRLNDNKNVVMKEIFTYEMNKNEKTAALNEVVVISSLDHPNIIRYLGNFESHESIVIIMEYADGGNLAQLINNKKEYKDFFTEKSILNIFSQITDAVGYMHKKKILHRDLKTANIFLNRNGTVKVGDFGISKILTTRTQAQTVVGTPYYLSPEICEGNNYNEKSDVWAVGCILYEMACLKKPFEAPTLPVLVQKITNCEYEEIPKHYSAGLSKLIHMILQKDHHQRPSAIYINNTLIPSLQMDINSQELSKFSLSSLFGTINSIQERSLLYIMQGFQNDMKIQPVELPHKKIIDFSISQTHFIVVTADGLVYTWGEDNYGQLGHEELSTNRKYPICVNYLRHRNIINCGAGDGYSIFLNANGVLYSCGDGSKGCLGLGDWNNVSIPTIISAILTISIIRISCGTNHVLALSSTGVLYSWGSSQYGQLGQGHTQYCCAPMTVKFQVSYKIEEIYAGYDTSMVLTTSGHVLACGNNIYNKLGFSLGNKIKVFTLLESVGDKIKNVSLGMYHTILITQNGDVITMGKNCDGQLGKGNYLTYIKPQYLNLEQRIIMSSCSPTFSVVATDRNVVMVWGTYYKINCQDNVNNDLHEQSVQINSYTTLPLLHTNTTEIPETHHKTTLNTTKNNCIPQFIKTPTSILGLYASNDNIKSNNILWLGGIKARNNDVVLLVHTTVKPPPYQDTENSNVCSNKFPTRCSNLNQLSLEMTHLPNTPQLP